MGGPGPGTHTTLFTRESSYFGFVTFLLGSLNFRRHKLNNLQIVDKSWLLQETQNTMEQISYILRQIKYKKHIKQKYKLLSSFFMNVANIYSNLKFKIMILGITYQRTKKIICLSSYFWSGETLHPLPLFCSTAIAFPSSPPHTFCYGCKVSSAFALHISLLKKSANLNAADTADGILFSITFRRLIKIIFQSNFQV